tara:strand:+ start:58 stop:486 length:429 start_codon:yes stop_codon:yes gene_type:complete
MNYSSVFKPAGKYAGLPGFSAGISLGENLTTPLGQQTIGGSISNESRTDELLNKYLERGLDPNAGKEALANKLAYDKEQMKQAFPYLMAREIPRQISEGFGNQAALTVLGARNTVDAMNQTLASYPQMSFPMTSFRAEKYLS